MKPSQGKANQRIKASADAREKRQMAERARIIRNHKCRTDGPCLFKFCPYRKEL